MALAQRTGRSRYRIALLVLTTLTLLTLDFRTYGPIENIQSGVRDVLQPIVSVTDTVLGPVGDVWKAVTDYNDVRNENEQLRAELDQLRGEAIQVEADREAYQRLLDATEIEYAGDIERLAASVVRESVGNFDDDLITIDRGRRHGVIPGMAVVTRAGFVGRIDTVDASQSTVELASSPSLTIGVRLIDTGEVGLGAGDSQDPTQFVIDTGLPWPETLDVDDLAEVGTAVVTAAESRYPADIPVGRIIEVQSGKGGLIQIVHVELAADTRDLGFVTVLLQRPTDVAPESTIVPTTIPFVTPDEETDESGDGS